MLQFSPLEQFEVIALVPLLHSCAFYLALTNSALFTFVILSVALVGLYLLCTKLTLIPTRWQLLAEGLFLFIKSILESSLGHHGVKYFPSIFFLFYFLACANLIGLIPYSFTVTSHIFVTFALALYLFIGITLTGIQLHKLTFLGLFLPSGAPLVLAPLFVALEILSYTIRVISLAVRLFANLMAGHSLLKILAGFTWTMLSLGGIWTVVQFVPLLIILAVTILELAIAFVQAYVFSLLICLYLNDAITLH